MIVMAENQHYYCALMDKTGENFDICAQAKTLCWREKKPEDASNLRDVLAAMQADGPDYWRWIFAHANNSIFVLFEKSSSGQDPIAGIAEVHIEKRGDLEYAYFCSSHILTSYRGRGLSALLYEARLKYVLEETPCAYAKLEIKHGNEPSIRAALRNGFLPRAFPIADNMVFTCDLDALRNPQMVLDGSLLDCQP
jgi:RimJ/RimL family protein N-acetyltransferase